jgi:hypothetical protein
VVGSSTCGSNQSPPLLTPTSSSGSHNNWRGADYPHPNRVAVVCNRPFYHPSLILSIDLLGFVSLQRRGSSSPSSVGSLPRSAQILSAVLRWGWTRQDADVGAWGGEESRLRQVWVEHAWVGEQCVLANSDKAERRRHPEGAALVTLVGNKKGKNIISLDP